MHDLWVDGNNIYIATAGSGLFVSEFDDSYSGGVLVDRTLVPQETYQMIYPMLRDPSHPEIDEYRATHSVVVDAGNTYAIVTDEANPGGNVEMEEKAGILRVFDLNDATTPITASGIPGMKSSR